MYNNYEIKIIKNDIYIPKNSDSDESDYEYLYNDELQILSKSGEILFNIKNFEFRSYEFNNNFLILDIDEGHEYSDKFLYINLDTFKIHYQWYKYNNTFYGIFYDKINKKIDFEYKLYDINYFFDNINIIIDEFEYQRHKFDTTKNTLLKSIFDMFDKHIDNNSQIKINGFTYGMSTHDIRYFKNILRDNTKSIERQLFEVLFGHTIGTQHRIYDIDLTIHYKDNNIDKSFRIILECKDKIPKQYFDKILYYGYYDENAKLQIIE
jgi:hypothetical protein